MKKSSLRNFETPSLKHALVEICSVYIYVSRRAHIYTYVCQRYLGTMETVERSNVPDAGETGCCGRTSSRSTKAKFANFAHYAAKGTWDFLDDILPYIPFVNFL